MKLILSHISALHAYRIDISGIRSGSTFPASSRKYDLIPYEFSPAITPIESQELYERFGLRTPLHSLCTKRTTSYRSPYITKHFVQRPTELDNPIRLSEGLWISSPEMLFVQMAELLELGELIEIGFEFCGGYSLPTDPVNPRARFNIPPLTSKAQLMRYLGGISERNGLPKARLAAKHICDNSWSPMETKAAILLGLPRSHGGKGLGLPTMNHQIKLDQRTCRAIGQSNCYCDLYWPSRKIAVEYDSTMAHNNESSLRRDSLRRTALKQMGVEVLSLTDIQVMDKLAFDKFAETLAKCLHKKQHKPTQTFYKAERELRKQLLSKRP